MLIYLFELKAFYSFCFISLEHNHERKRASNVYTQAHDKKNEFNTCTHINDYRIKNTVNKKPTKKHNHNL